MRSLVHDSINGESDCTVVEECGGCPWLTVSATDERAHKVNQLKSLLRTLNHEQTQLEFVASPQRLHYRNRIRLRIDDQGQIRFFNARKSPQCVVLEPGLRRFLSQLHAVAATSSLNLKPFAHLEARIPDDLGRAGLYLTHLPTSPNSDAEVAAISVSLGSALVATDRATTVPHQRFAIAKDVYLLVPLDGFMQINAAVNRLLIQYVAQGAAQAQWRSFGDLYGGAGNFAVRLVSAGLSGILVEQNRASVLAASKAAAEQGLKQLDVRLGDAIDVARGYVAEQCRFDGVILDPPRAGVRTGLDVVSALARNNIVYCSCNLESLTRDLKQLKSHGWRLQRLVGFDMFPGTHHLEAMAWLVRNEKAAQPV